MSVQKLPPLPVMSGASEKNGFEGWTISKISISTPPSGREFVQDRAKRRHNLPPGREFVQDGKIWEISQICGVHKNP